MALHTLGTNSTTSLSAIQWSPSPSVLSEADLAAIAQSITADDNFGLVLQGGSPGAAGILATGSTHTNTTLDTLVSTGGGPLAAIQVGQLVLGVGIPPGTFVSSVTSGTAVVLSQAATGSASIRVAFISSANNMPKVNRTGLLTVPNRGILRLWPNDVVAIDNTGAVIVLPATAISYAGSLWTFT
jgi:hypothetical protein